VEHVLGITGGDPSFRDDDGAADAAVLAAMRAFAAGEGSETAALAELARSRLLVPVVAVLAEQVSEMAMPTLIGMDGRRAVPAFTSLESMRSWRASARPVPVAARHVWQAAVADSCAVVIDVAGPVPLAVEGARLAALARGEVAPTPWSDPDVQEIVADVLARHLDVAGFELRPGEVDGDLVIVLTLAPDGAGQDVTVMAEEVADAVLSRLGGRLRRGLAICMDGTGRR
jgi:hypothetical protein